MSRRITYAISWMDQAGNCEANLMNQAKGKAREYWRDRMKVLLNLITTFATVYALSYAIGLLCAELGLPEYVSMIIGLSLGFFGSRVIFNWLSKPDTDMEQDSGLE